MCHFTLKCLFGRWSISFIIRHDFVLKFTGYKGLLHLMGQLSSETTARFADSSNGRKTRNSRFWADVITVVTSPFQWGSFPRLTIASGFLVELDNILEVFILIGGLIWSLAKLLPLLTILLKLFFKVLLVPKVFHDLPNFRFAFLRTNNALGDFQPIELVLINEFFSVLRNVLTEIHMGKAVHWSFTILYADLKLASILGELSLVHFDVFVDRHLRLEWSPFFEYF